MKKPKGFKPLLENTNNPSLSLKDLETYLMNSFKDAAKNNVVIGQWCKTQGFVERIAGVDLKLCGDPECVSCSMFITEIKKVCKSKL